MFDIFQKKSSTSRQHTSSREGNSDSEVPTKKIVLKRRTQHQHQNTASYHRAFLRSRKSKLSTNNNNNTLTNGNANNDIGQALPSSRTNHANIISSSDDDDDAVPTQSSNGYFNRLEIAQTHNQTDLNVPSTSTGITDNGRRLVFEKVSSDDESSAAARITNGHSSKYLNGHKLNDIFSSQSNSRLSNSSCQDDATSNDSFSSEYFTKRRKINHTVVIENDIDKEAVEEEEEELEELDEDDDDDNVEGEDIESELEEIEQEIVEHLVDLPHLEITPAHETHYLDDIDEDFTTNNNDIEDDDIDDDEEDYLESLPTPHKAREMHNYTPDSGIATAVCSSSGSATNNTEQNTPNDQNGDGNSNLSHILLNQRINRVRRNYRNKFADDDTDEENDDDDDDDGSDSD